MTSLQTSRTPTRIMRRRWRGLIKLICLRGISWHWRPFAQSNWRAILGSGRFSSQRRFSTSVPSISLRISQPSSIKPLPLAFSLGSITRKESIPRPRKESIIARTSSKQINLFLNRALHRLRQLMTNAIQKAAILPRQFIGSLLFLSLSQSHQKRGWQRSQDSFIYSKLQTPHEVAKFSLSHGAS
jgi:hypothetical protein